jgi:hypothetical protein
MTIGSAKSIGTAPQYRTATDSPLSITLSRFPSTRITIIRDAFLSSRRLAQAAPSVEADVHLRNSDLLVGHMSPSLHGGSTLRSMYLKPMQRMLEMQNAHIINGTWRGIFDQTSQKTAVLLIDHKTAGQETFAELNIQLQPLRDLDYLTY